MKKSINVMANRIYFVFNYEIYFGHVYRKAKATELCLIVLKALNALESNDD